MYYHSKSGSNGKKKGTPQFPNLQDWIVNIGWQSVISSTLFRVLLFSEKMQSVYSIASADWTGYA